MRDSKNDENGAKVDQGKEIEEFLKKESVDVVVGSDLARGDIVRSLPFPSPSFDRLFPSTIYHLDLYTCHMPDVVLVNVSSATSKNLEWGYFVT